MIRELLNDYQVILASQSPRRQHLLTELGIPFEIMVNHDLEETYPEGLTKEEIPVYLAKLKAGAAMPVISDKTLLITADTCLTLPDKQHTFFASTFVYFSDLTEGEISYYIDKWKPYDKAGAYGIQEWIGYIGIERIDGSYFNVMGLPVQRLYQELKTLLSV